MSFRATQPGLTLVCCTGNWRHLPQEVLAKVWPGLPSQFWVMGQLKNDAVQYVSCEKFPSVQCVLTVSGLIIIAVDMTVTSAA